MSTSYLLPRQRRVLFLAAAIVFAGSNLALAQQVLAPTTFATTNIGATSGSQTLTFSGLPAQVSVTEVSGTDFLVSPVCGGGTCTISVSFAPKYPGLREDAVLVINQTSGAILGIGPLNGIGAGPQIAIGPGLISTLVNRANATLTGAVLTGVAIGPGGRVYVADSATSSVYYINPTSGSVTRYAGNGTAGYSGDGAAATAGELSTPTALAFDASANLYIADTGNNVIREVNASNGVITTVAGTGVAGNGGDGGNANAAQLHGPEGLAIDAQGNLYISDTGNNRIRKVTAIGGQITASSQIAAFAGNGTPGFSGDGSSATSAELNQPVGIGLDSSGNNLYIADSNNSVIRKVSGGNISTVAGTGGSAGYSGDGGVATSAQLNQPWAVAVDAAGSLYIADKLNEVVRKVTGDTNHTISTIAGTHAIGYTGDGGMATSAALSQPASVVLDGPGNLYILDYFNYAVREVAASGAPLTFPLTANGNTSGPMTLTVSNTGDASLTFTGLTITGNFSQTASTNQCSASTVLAQGASCTVAILFNSTGTVPSGAAVSIVANSLNQSGTQSLISLNESTGLRFIQMTPCRVIDTRVADGYSGSFLTGGVPRTYVIPSTPNCTVPNTALAFSFNIAVVPHGSLTFLAMWPSGVAQPGVATLNSYDGRVKSAAAIIPASTGGGISVFATGDTELVVDIDGYFVPSTAPNYSAGLAFYSITPCRVADTRVATGSLGGPSLGAGTSRAFPVLSSSCAASIPGNVAAYSLNLAAVPPGPLIYLTAWPTGQSQPVSAVLNAPTATVTANAAIVPAGTSGQISVYASNTTDLVIDINGYFAPSGGTNGLSLYTVTPCRVLDTRGSSGVFSGTLTVPVQSVTCGTGNIPTTAEVYVTNSTVVPSGPLAFITTWAEGAAQPLQATLNSDDGSVMSNLGLIPTTNGSIAVFASNPTQLIVDVFGYFAP